VLEGKGRKGAHTVRDQIVVRAAGMAAQPHLLDRSMQFFHLLLVSPAQCLELVLVPLLKACLLSSMLVSDLTHALLMALLYTSQTGLQSRNGMNAGFITKGGFALPDKPAEAGKDMMRM
jgi:hypothetical protein